MLIKHKAGQLPPPLGVTLPKMQGRIELAAILVVLLLDNFPSIMTGEFKVVLKKAFYITF
jgi:hypothetical protein